MKLNTHKVNGRFTKSCNKSSDIFHQYFFAEDSGRNIFT